MERLHHTLWYHLFPHSTLCFDRANLSVTFATCNFKLSKFINFSVIFGVETIIGSDNGSIM